MLKWLFDPVRIAIETVLLGSILIVALMVCMALEVVRDGAQVKTRDGGKDEN